MQPPTDSTTVIIHIKSHHFILTNGVLSSCSSCCKSSSRWYRPSTGGVLMVLCWWTSERVNDQLPPASPFSSWSPLRPLPLRHLSSAKKTTHKHVGILKYGYRIFGYLHGWERPNHRGNGCFGTRFLVLFGYSCYHKGSAGQNALCAASKSLVFLLEHTFAKLRCKLIESICRNHTHVVCDLNSNIHRLKIQMNPSRVIIQENNILCSN